MTPPLFVPADPSHPANIAARSPHWPAVRHLWLLASPRCAYCGGVARLQVHHILPFHLAPTRELDVRNLIALCEAPGLDCHLLVGHRGDWRLYESQIVDICRDHSGYCPPPLPAQPG